MIYNFFSDLLAIPPIFTMKIFVLFEIVNFEVPSIWNLNMEVYPTASRGQCYACIEVGSRSWKLFQNGNNAEIGSLNLFWKVI